MSDPAMRTVNVEQDARRRATYEAAPGDREAAAILGIDKKKFGQWRRRAGLPSKRRRGTVPIPIEIAVARLVRLYGISAIRETLGGWSP